MASRSRGSPILAGFLAWIALACAACVTQQTIPPYDDRAPSTRVTTTPTSTQAATADVAHEESAAPIALRHPPKVDRQRALERLEAGRAMMRERGEDGAMAAIAMYEEALAHDPSLADAHWEIGWAYQVLSNWDAVLLAWDRVRALSPDHPQLNLHYALAQMRRNEAKKLESLPDPAAGIARDEAWREGPRLRIAAVGDVQLGRAWPEERAALPPNEAMDLLTGAHEALVGHDVTFGNLETVLADGGDSEKCGKKSTKCFAFRVPTSFARALAAAGFTVMSTANNHAGDFGPEGRLATMKALDDVGIRHSGVVGDTAQFPANGLRIALVGFSTGGGVYRVQELDVAKKVIFDLRRRHDIVIVSFHAGAEGADAGHVPTGPEVFYGEGRGEVRKFAHLAVDFGADLVLGHGPHVLRGLEIYRGRLIAYSLGNFSTWETFNLTGPLGVTVVLHIELLANGVVSRVEARPFVIEKPGRPRPDPERRGVSLLRELSREDFGNPVLDDNGVWVRRR